MCVIKYCIMTFFLTKVSPVISQETPEEGVFRDSQERHVTFLLNHPVYIHKCSLQKTVKDVLKTRIRGHFVVWDLNATMITIPIAHFPQGSSLID